ncbi:hypothetical protein JB92DRAFT_3001735 [Gautieria morchelliformis]|nr:hypothetical protein JB92DRAFT_3001735 [Gautieria morchelliformis]
MDKPSVMKKLMMVIISRFFSCSSNSIKATRNFSTKPSIRKYSTIVSSVRQHPYVRVDGPRRRSTPGLWDIPGLSEPSVKGTQSTQVSSPDADSSNIGGFSQSWKGEDWKGEKWNDVWGGKC